MTGLLISVVSAAARAEPPPAAAVAFTAPVPPTATALTPPPYGPGARPLGDAPAYQVPDYVYLPEASAPGMTGIPGMPVKRTWYGWQTLLVFGGSLTVGLAAGIGGGASGSTGTALVGVGVGGAGFLFGGPIVHWAHGNTGKGFGALGLNFGIPIVSGGLGVAITCAAGGCQSSDDGIGILLGLFVGGSVGLVASMVVDVSVLSYEPSTPVASTARRSAPEWTILPDFHVTREKTTFGFAGVF